MADKPPVEITEELLREWPLPQPAPAGDKEERGRLLIVGGAAEMPGALLLAATAALRVGAGKVQAATVAAVAPLLAVSVPEIRVFGLDATSGGGIDPGAADELIERAAPADAVLIGPGLVDDEAAGELLRRMLPELGAKPILLDAGALGGLRHAGLKPGRRAVLTPHAGELAMLLGEDKAAISAEPARFARQAAATFGGAVALKGAETWIAAGDKLYVARNGSVGLATGGSGDTLAGILAGLLARGADLPQAAAWAVFLHAEAGQRLVRRLGPLGFLARELGAELPPLLAKLAPQGAST